MRDVYEASNNVEAHMIVDLLRQEHIRGVVQGDYLQGAAGGLPAMGLVRVMVDDADFELARRVIERWSTTQAADFDAAPPAAAARAGWGVFLAGVVVGVLAGTAAGTLFAPPHPAQVELCR